MTLDEKKLTCENERLKASLWQCLSALDGLLGDSCTPNDDDPAVKAMRQGLFLLGYGPKCPEEAKAESELAGTLSPEDKAALDAAGWVNGWTGEGVSNAAVQAELEARRKPDGLPILNKFMSWDRDIEGVPCPIDMSEKHRAWFTKLAAICDHVAELEAAQKQNAATFKEINESAARDAARLKAQKWKIQYLQNDLASAKKQIQAAESINSKDKSLEAIIVEEVEALTERKASQQPTPYYQQWQATAQENSRLEAELQRLREQVNAKYWEGVAAENTQLRKSLETMAAQWQITRNERDEARIAARRVLGE